MVKILILGGTYEARQLAIISAEKGFDALYSYAGVTNSPLPIPLPTRIGGFGGVDGLVSFIEDNTITAIVDATHPFAAQISHNACKAAEKTGIALLALERPSWQPQSGDQWQIVNDMADAVAALPQSHKHVFLAIGRKQLHRFYEKNHHSYLLRLVNALQDPLPFNQYDAIISKGPFSVEEDQKLLNQYKIDLIVTKNSGGESAYAKLEAARHSDIPVIMIARPELPQRKCCGTVDGVVQWLHQQVLLGV